MTKGQFLYQTFICLRTFDGQKFNNTNMAGDNPYLAHLPPSQRGAGPSRPNDAIREPLYGFIPRKVNGEQARKAMVCSTQIQRLYDLTASQSQDINPFTKLPLSSQYKKILEARRKLPVYAKMDEFFQVVRGQFRGCLRRV